MAGGGFAGATAVSAEWDWDEQTPDHSTIWRTRRLINIDTHREVLAWVLALLAERGLLKGQRMGIDATHLGSECGDAVRSCAGTPGKRMKSSCGGGQRVWNRDADARGSGTAGP